MTAKPKVSIIVLNYNGLAWLKKCIPTIKKQTYKNIEIIVTDNHSNDGSIEYLKKQKDIKLIANPDNFGYAKANNIGAEYAKGEFLFFLNNDTELYPNTIENLINCYEPNSIISPVQIRPWKKNDNGYANIGMDIFGYPYGRENPRKNRPFYVDGAAIFIKHKDFTTIGMFDEELFIFQEDVDLSWRAQLMGYSIVTCWDAKLLHYGGATVTGGVVKNQQYVTSYFRRYLNEKNIIRNIIKNYSFPLGIPLLAMLIIIHTLEMIVLAILGKFKAVKCYLDAYWWNIAHIKSTLQYREKVQRERTVSDSEILKRVYWSYSKLIAFKNLGFPKFQ